MTGGQADFEKQKNQKSSVKRERVVHSRLQKVTNTNLYCIHSKPRSQCRPLNVSWTFLTHLGRKTNHGEKSMLKSDLVKGIF